MKMKHPKLPLILILAIAFLPACAAVAPGNDPIVVNAERTTAAATDAFDFFLKTESDLAPTLRAVAPDVYGEVHHYAEFLRTKVPDSTTGTDVRRAKQWLLSARRLTVVYKTNRTPENKANLQTILNTISAAVAEAQKYLLRMNTVTKHAP